jgi:hypothetical protein
VYAQTKSSLLTETTVSFQSGKTWIWRTERTLGVNYYTSGKSSPTIERQERKMVKAQEQEVSGTNIFLSFLTQLAALFIYSYVTIQIIYIWYYVRTTNRILKVLIFQYPSSSPRVISWDWRSGAVDIEISAELQYSNNSSWSRCLSYRRYRRSQPLSRFNDFVRTCNLKGL